MRAHLALMLALAAAGPVAAEAKLSPADARYLDGLMKDLLFDPAGAERVRVKLPEGSPYRRTGALAPRDGWLVRGTGGRPDRVHFADGWSIPAPPPGRIERIDFPGQAARLFNAVQPPGTDTAAWVRQTAADVFGEADPLLALTAWHHRLGHDRAAAGLLDLARTFSEDPDADLRNELGRHALGRIAELFGAGDDAATLAACADYRRRYPSEAQLGGVAAVAADVRRRLTVCLLGTGPALNKPVDTSTWSVERRVAAHLDRLLDLRTGDGFHPGYPEPHPEMAALTDLGEAAVPALLAVLDRDERLTRCTLLNGSTQADLWLDPYSARYLANRALGENFRLQTFPAAPGEDASAEHWPQALGRFRHFWKTYGLLPRDERMMRLLTDPQVPALTKREAAANLADTWGRDGGSWDRPRVAGRPAAAGPRPAAGTFQNPTAAEAVLAAVDREWAAWIDGQVIEEAPDAWASIEAEYLNALVALGDRRIATVLGGRAAAVRDPRVRQDYAAAARALGDGAAWQQFARDVERGTVPLDGRAAFDGLQGRLTPAMTHVLRIAEAMVRSRTADDDRALWAMTDRRHPYYPHLRGAVTNDRHRLWARHRFGLTVLRREAADHTPTGKSYTWTEPPPDDRPAWAVTGEVVPEAAQRACDGPALQLSELLIGAPMYHPLRRDADVQLGRLIDFFDTHRHRLRPATDAERELLDDFQDHALIPDLTPLGRPATAADVKAGAAVFHLDGAGRVWTGPLPVKVVMKADAKKKHPPVGLVVQAEADGAGKVVYGVIFRHAVRMVRADEVE